MKRVQIKRSKGKKFLNRESIVLYLVGIVLILFVFSSRLFFKEKNIQKVQNPEYTASQLELRNNYSTLLVPIDLEEIKVSLSEFEKNKVKAEYNINKEIKIDRLYKFLVNQHSRIATKKYARLIFELSEANDADYRVIVAIMGVESGFCNAPYMLNGNNSFNCFGYINRVQYDSFEDAFNALIPKIASQYANKYGWNFEALAKAYGQSNWQSAANKMRRYANSL